MYTERSEQRIHTQPRALGVFKHPGATHSATPLVLMGTACTVASASLQCNGTAAGFPRSKGTHPVAALAQAAARRGGGAAAAG